MFRKHFPVDWISRFRVHPSSISDEERSQLARHLSTDCPRCWSAVADLAPGSEQISSDPMAEALNHVSTPKGYAVLGADHLAANAEVCERPFGFAFLLVEEAHALGQSCETPQPLEDDVLKIIGTLPPGHHRRRHEDLYVKALAYLSQVRTLRHELDSALVAVHLAEKHRQSGTGDERVHATVLEARALWAADRDPREANALLTAALDRLAGHREHALRRFELYARLADIVVGAGEIGRVPAILDQAHHALAPVRESDDPLTRAWAVFQQAKLTTVLAVRLKSQVDLGSAVRWAADELEAAGELFVRYTNDTTQTLRLLCLSRLYTFFDTQRAVTVYRKAIGLNPEHTDQVDNAELETAFDQLIARAISN